MDKKMLLVVAQMLAAVTESLKRHNINIRHDLYEHFAAYEKSETDAELKSVWRGVAQAFEPHPPPILEVIEGGKDQDQ